MEFIFEIPDRTGRKIHLSKERWSHIRIEHPLVENIEELKITLTNPVKIMQHEYGELYDYYCYFKNKKQKSKYLKVVVKYLNGVGFILTAYFVKSINK